MDDRLITIAIHTYERALELKSLLESEGIEAVLQNVNLSSPIIASGVRVRIKEHDLPAALRIIENREIFMGSPLTSSDRLCRGVFSCLWIFRLCRSKPAKRLSG